MITSYKRSKIIKRILTDKFGNKYQILFLVVQKGSSISAKIIKVELIAVSSDLLLNSDPVKYSHLVDTPIFRKNRIVIDNSFFISQLTRAPSYV